MRQSVLDRYMNFMRGDAKYFEQYLKWSGTEVVVLKPRKDVIENYVTAFGTSASTFERIPKYYTFITGYINVDPLAFGYKENVADIEVLVYLPNTKIDAGDLLQFERTHKRYTYSINPLQNYQDFLYMSTIRLLDVEEIKEE